MNILRASQWQISASFWTWIFPVTYLIHIAEEYWGGEGYSSYLLRLRGITLSPTRFLAGQAVAFVLMMIGVILAKHLKLRNQMIVILGSVVFVNGLTHCVQTVAHGQYVPGLFTAILLWLPLGIATLLRFKKLRTRSYWISVALGVGIILGVEILIISS